MIANIIAALGTAVSGFFGFKGQQAQSINSALDVLAKSGDIDSQAVVAAAQIINSEANNQSWLARNWRPMFMVFFGCLIGARWFGYVPSNMSENELMEIYGLFKMGIGGYIGSRGLEKIISSLGISSTLQKFIEKKLG